MTEACPICERSLEKHSKTELITCLVKLLENHRILSIHLAKMESANR